MNLICSHHKTFIDYGDICGMALAEPKKKALIIAISNYNKLDASEQLPFCKNDGNAMKQVLSKDEAGFQITDALIGTVTSEQMEKSLKQFFRGNEVAADDILVLYYSGHGTPFGFGKDEYYFATSDTEPKRPDVNGVSFDLLTTLVNNSKSLNKIIILDCCHAGAVQLSKAVADTRALDGARFIQNNFSQEGGKYLLASSLGTQKSFGMDNGQYSIFTNFLVKGIDGSNSDSLDKNGNVTPALLGTYIFNQMKNLELHQRPIRKTEEIGNPPILASYPGKVPKSPDAQVDPKSVHKETLKSLKRALEHCWENFQAQKNLIDELENMLVEKYGSRFKYRNADAWLKACYPKIKTDDAARFKANYIRQLTNNLYEYNLQTLNLMKSDKSITDEYPELLKLYAHLELWIAKYRTYRGSDKMFIIFVGEIEKKGFPKDIGRYIDDKLRALESS